MARKYEEIIGRRFGLLVVAAKAAEPRKYLCFCDCGNETIARRDHLLRGATRSCGCGCIKHGLLRGVKGGAKRPDGEASWRGMISRCCNPKDKSYKNYGGRGIRVCDRWRSLAAFLEDMGPRPTSAHSLDRIDVNGDYEPGNCRWATPAEQCQNQRRNTMTAETAALARQLRGDGLSYRQIARRLGVPTGTAADAARGITWQLPAGQLDLFVGRAG